MIHSRPGFSPVVTKEGKKAPPPAKLNSDMQPAIATRTSPAQGAVKSPLKQEQATLPVDRMQAQAEAALKRMQEQKRQVGPEILVNPAPSATPILTSPHKD